ncbi:YetF domain-containing protein [Hymenobacter bucti]|uniref:YetF domain-containing protein n=1 Tax=Hymenobacter bucti TaxID=1844114 RepID=A0ABW4QTZ8_9BACT
MPPAPPPKLTDYLRILMGDMPWSFLLEASIRLVLMYLLLLLGLRLMGKRMAGQLSRTELAALMSLAAAIGIPLLSADRGLLSPLIIASVVVIGQQLTARWSARRRQVERVLQSTLTPVVANGVLQLDHMEHVVLSQERLFAELRGENLEHLGQVNYLFLEANGTFSLVEEKEPQPGLSLIPGWDKEFRDEQPVAAGTFACIRCGQVLKAPQKPTSTCPHCEAQQWEPAVLASK